MKRTFFFINHLTISLTLSALFLLSHAHAIEVGDRAPELVLPDIITGKKVRLSPLHQNKNLAILFWSNWCRSCPQELDFISDLQNEYLSEILKVISINLDEEVSDAYETLQLKQHPSHRILHDHENLSIRHYELRDLPALVLIDPTGRISVKEAGYRKKDKQRVKDLIRSKLTIKAQREVWLEQKARAEKQLERLRQINSTQFGITNLPIQPIHSPTKEVATPLDILDY